MKVNYMADILQLLSGYISIEVALSAVNERTLYLNCQVIALLIRTIKKYIIIIVVDLQIAMEGIKLREMYRTSYIYFNMSCIYLC
jgi:hypothetical protein